jgi:uncharacterized membrane protein YphA (DoxX/SURF4 family)
MKQLTTIGRILFGLPFGILGLNHFIMYNYYMGTVSSFIPLGGYTVIIAGIALIAASVAIISKKFIRTACLMLALLLFIFIVSIHIPGLFNADKMKMTIAMIELLKDTTLMGGALLIAGIYSQKETTV